MAEDKKANHPAQKGTDIMEGASRATNNRGYEAAAQQLRNSFNPNHVREIDTAAYQFCPQHVFKRNEDGSLKIVYFAGEHVSNVDLALIEKLMKDTKAQEEGIKVLEDAGYVTTAEEPEVEAKVLA